MCVLRHFRGAIPALAAVLLASLPLHAQGRWSAAVQGGLAFPTGDFADDDSEEAGLATLGLTLGAELALRVGSGAGIEWVSNLQGVSFGVDDALFGDLGGVDVDVGRYWGVLLMSGLRYRPGEGSTRAQLAAQLVAGGMRAPNATLRFMGESAELVSSWAPAKGYSVGAGVSFGERFSVDARYEALLNTEVSAELRYQGTVEEFEGDQPMSWIRITASYRLR